MCDRTLHTFTTHGEVEKRPWPGKDDSMWCLKWMFLFPEWSNTPSSRRLHMMSKQKSSEGEYDRTKTINKHNIIQIISSLLRKRVYTLKSTERKLESTLMLGMCERRPCPGSVRLKTASFSLSYWLVPLLRGEHTHTIIHHHTHSVLTMWWKILHLFSPSSPALLLDVCVCVCVYVVVHVSITSCPHTHLICEILSVFKYRLTVSWPVNISLTPHIVHAVAAPPV